MACCQEHISLCQIFLTCFLCILHKSYPRSPFFIGFRRIFPSPVIFPVHSFCLIGAVLFLKPQPTANNFTSRFMQKMRRHNLTSVMPPQTSLQLSRYIIFHTLLSVYSARISSFAIPIISSPVRSTSIPIRS